MDFYVTTKLDKFIKKNVATLIKRMAMKLMSRHKELKIEEKLCHDKIQLCHYLKSTISFEGLEDSVATEKFYVAIENGRDMRPTKTSMS